MANCFTPCSGVTPQLSTHLKGMKGNATKISKQSMIKKTNQTNDTLETILKKEDGFNRLGRNMGTNAITLMHKYTAYAKRTRPSTPPMLS